MAKTMKVLDIHHGGLFYQAYYKRFEMNPYCLYQLYWDVDQYGHATKRKKLIAKYADMKSVLWHLAQEA